MLLLRFSDINLFKCTWSRIQLLHIWDACKNKEKRVLKLYIRKLYRSIYLPTGQQPPLWLPSTLKNWENTNWFTPTHSIQHNQTIFNTFSKQICQNKPKYPTSKLTSSPLCSQICQDLLRLSIMSCLVFDLISFKGSYFVKECYYTLAVVDLHYSWPPK